MQASLKSRAVKKGDHYIINGSKVFITNGGEAEYIYRLCVYKSRCGKNGISAFIVEKDTPGLIIGKDEQRWVFMVLVQCNLRLKI